MFCRRSESTDLNLVWIISVYSSDLSYFDDLLNENKTNNNPEDNPNEDNPNEDITNEDITTVNPID